MSHRRVVRPPRLARALMGWVASSRHRQGLLRELDEEFAQVVMPEEGRRRAQFWYWKQVALSVWPMATMQAEQRRFERPARTGGVQVIDQLKHELKWAWRGLARRPALASAAVATCAIGIAASGSVLSVVDTVLFRELPYPEPDRLVRVWSNNPRGIARNSVSPPDFFDWRDQTDAFTGLAGIGVTQATLLDAEPTRIVAADVTTGFFDVVRLAPTLGRVLLAGDHVAMTPEVVVLSQSFWVRQFGGDADIVGRVLTIDDTPLRVVGVMPSALALPIAGVDAWRPLSDAMRNINRSAHFLGVVGRLADDVSPERARATLEAAADRLAVEYPTSNEGWGITMTTLDEAITGDARRPLLVALGAVMAVLLIAAANVANLFLARGADRQRDVAVSAALGASRHRVLRQQFVESLLVAVVGGSIGLLGVWWFVGLARGGIGLDLPRLETLRFDWRVVAGAVSLTALTAVLAGVMPAWRASRLDPGPILAVGPTRGTTSRRRAQTALVIAQVAISLTLLIGAGLLARSFVALRQVDVGAVGSNVLLASVAAPNRFTAVEANQAFDDLRARFSRLPGVASVGGGAPLFLSGTPGLFRFGVRIDGVDLAATGRSDRVYLRRATPGFFEAMGIELLEGRTFDARDSTDAPPVALVDETFAQLHFAGESALGRRVRSSNSQTFREIVGVVGGVRQTSLQEQPEPHLYVPPSQMAIGNLVFAIRTRDAVSTLVPAVRDAVSGAKRDLLLSRIVTLDELVRDAAGPEQFNAAALGLFSLVAALLSAVGIYGVMAGWVGESTREIGIRMALGAERSTVAWFVLWRGLRVVAAGAGIGLLLALAGSEVLSSLLFGVTARDPAVFLLAIFFVVSVGFLTTALPARRALSVDPAESLK